MVGTTRLPVRQGISAPVVTNIPTTWNPSWFQGFITNFLQYSDARNAVQSPDVQISGNIDHPATISTQPFTIVASKPANTTSISSILTSDPDLTLNFTIPGSYAVEVFLPIYEENVGNGGFQFNLGGGTATTSATVMGILGFSNAITSVGTATAVLAPSISSTSPNWIISKGYLMISSAGTLSVQWAQNVQETANPTVLMQGAYITATKIG